MARPWAGDIPLFGSHLGTQRSPQGSQSPRGKCQAPDWGGYMRSLTIAGENVSCFIHKEGEGYLTVEVVDVEYT